MGPSEHRVTSWDLRLLNSTLASSLLLSLPICTPHRRLTPGPLPLCPGGPGPSLQSGLAHSDAETPSLQTRSFPAPTLQGLCSQESRSLPPKSKPTPTLFHSQEGYGCGLRNHREAYYHPPLHIWASQCPRFLDKCRMRKSCLETNLSSSTPWPWMGALSLSPAQIGSLAWSKVFSSACPPTKFLSIQLSDPCPQRSV